MPTEVPRRRVSRGAESDASVAPEVRLLAPSPALNGDVLGFFCVAGGASLRGRRLLPDGGMDLLFNLDRVRNEPDAGAVGVLTHARTVSRVSVGRVAPTELPLIGVAFAPGVAFSYLRTPLHEFRDRTVPLEELWGRDGGLLLEQLQDAPSMTARGEVLSTYLERRKRASRNRQDELAQLSARVIRRRAGRLTMHELVDETGIGERRLQRLFRERIGLSPKELARIERLHAALARIRRGLVPSWSALAHDFGYSDQAHMIREFRVLTGRTPPAYGHEPALSDSFNTPTEMAAMFT